MELKGKNAIVTGANRGIGRAVVEILAQSGVNVWACSRTPSTEFEETLERISKDYSVWIKPIYYDLRDEDEIKQGIKSIVDENKPIDILVNNAGFSMEGLFLMTPIHTIEEVFGVNFFSQLLIMQLVLKRMIRQKKGSIINICSVSGIDNEVGRVAYGSSKCALDFASKSIAKEVGSYGVRVNSIAPGFIDTDMWKVRNVDLAKKVLNETPLSRQGSPYDVAYAVRFLASDESSYITGRTIVVDGGRL